MDQRKRMLLDVPVLKGLFFISVPVVFANLLQTVYQLTDTFWVGRLGAESVAAVSISFPIVFLMLSLAMGLTSAGTIFVSQYNGKGDKKMVNYVSAQTVLLTAISAVVVSVIGYVLAGPLISLIGAEDIVYAGAVSYIRIIFLGLIFMFSYANFISILRGVGEVKLPFYLVLFTVLLNFIVDPLFMFGFGPIPAMGVSGVALATVICQALAVLMGFVVLFRGNYGIKIHFRDLKVDFKWVRKLFYIGLPTSLEMSSRSIGMIFVTVLATGLGTVVLASLGIGLNILGIVIIPAVGLSISVSTMIGNNLGARKFERCDDIVKKSLMIIISFLLLIGVFVFFFAEPLVGFFIPGDPGVIVMAAELLRAMSVTFFCIGIQMIFIGTLRGAGKTRVSMILAFAQIGFLVAISLILTKYILLNEWGIWLAYPISNVLSVFVTYIVFKSVHWKKALV